MSYVIAVAGKGGTGKTSLCALLVKLFITQRKGALLAVDADPNDNLASALGLTAQRTIGSVIDALARRPESVPAGMTKERFLEYELQSAVQEAESFDLLTMGRPEGPGCYCYVNNILRNVMHKLVVDYDLVIIDNEAGLEHLSRKTAEKIDLLLSVADATSAGIKAAQRVFQLAQELSLHVGRKALLVNKCPSQADCPFAGSVPAGVEYLGFLPFDMQVASAGMQGSSLLDLSVDSAAFAALRGMKII